MKDYKSNFQNNYIITENKCQMFKLKTNVSETEYFMYGKTAINGRYIVLNYESAVFLTF